MLDACQVGKADGADPWVLSASARCSRSGKFLNEVGPDNLTTARDHREGEGFKGPLRFGAPALQCGKYTDAPAVCNDHTQFYKYNGEEPVQEGGGLRGPPEGPWQDGLEQRPAGLIQR